VKDFLTRVAERALGTAPRINPQATSRYAPARLPLPESRLPETPALAVNPPRSLRARQPDREEAPAAKMIVPSVEPVHEDVVRVNAPEPTHKADLSPLPLEPAPPPANELDSGPEFVPQKSTKETTKEISAKVSPVVHAPLPEPQGAEASSASAFSDDAAAEVDHSPVRFEAPDVPGRRDDESYPLRAASFVENEAAPVAKHEVQRRLPQSRPPKTVETIVAESNVITESIEVPSNPPLELVADETATAKVSQPRERERRQTVRAAVSKSDDPRPAATTERRDYERPERRERNIQVKIGRVEVHAPPAPVTSVEPVASPVPKLSLAEFLREHNRRRE